eukprot:s3614_g5.t3
MSILVWQLLATLMTPTCGFRALEQTSKKAMLMYQQVRRDRAFVARVCFQSETSHLSNLQRVHVKCKCAGCGRSTSCRRRRQRWFNYTSGCEWRNSATRPPCCGKAQKDKDPSFRPAVPAVPLYQHQKAV